MALILMLFAGVAAGLWFDVFVLAALCFAITLAGIGCAVWTGAWNATMTLALGILVLQIGYAVGMFVADLALLPRSNPRLTPDP